MISVLSIEDEKDFTEELVTFFTDKHPGYRIHIANDKTTALSILEKESIDAILLDLRLPIILYKDTPCTGVGFELLSEIKGKHPTICVLVVTVFDDLKNAVFAMRLGAYDYIPKHSTSFADIKTAIDKGIEYQRLKTDREEKKESSG